MAKMKTGKRMGMVFVIIILMMFLFNSLIVFGSTRVYCSLAGYTSDHYDIPMYNTDYPAGENCGGVGSCSASGCYIGSQGFCVCTTTCGAGSVSCTPTIQWHQGVAYGFGSGGTTSCTGTVASTPCGQSRGTGCAKGTYCASGTCDVSSGQCLSSSCPGPVLTFSQWPAGVCSYTATCLAKMQITKAAVGASNQWHVDYDGCKKCPGTCCEPGYVFNQPINNINVYSGMCVEDCSYTGRCGTDGSCYDYNYWWYHDGDGDGYGDQWDGYFGAACGPFTLNGKNYIADNTDCDDSDAAMKPTIDCIADTLYGNYLYNNPVINEKYLPTAINISKIVTSRSSYCSGGVCRPLSSFYARLMSGGNYQNIGTNIDYTYVGPYFNINYFAFYLTYQPGIMYNNYFPLNVSIYQCTQMRDNCARNWYQDYDGDTFGNPAVSIRAREQPAGYVRDNTDCNDNNAAINPNTVWYLDADSDSFYPTGGIRTQCTSPGAGWSTTVKTAGDCDDNNAALTPNTVWYLDADGDGYYPAGGVRTQCTSPGAGWSTTVKTAGDCNDADASLWNANQVWYLDADVDGYSPISGGSVTQCNSPGASWGKTVKPLTDCDDSKACLQPNQRWFTDVDLDFKATSVTPTLSCTRPANTYTDGSALSVANCNALGYNRAFTGYADCNDSNSCVWDPTVNWYLDADGDNYYPTSISQCNRPNTNYFAINTVPSVACGLKVSIIGNNDCNDANLSINPAATEICDGVDNNCNTFIDEGCPSFTSVLLQTCGNNSYNTTDLSNLVSFDSYYCPSLDNFRISGCTGYPVLPMVNNSFTIKFLSDVASSARCVATVTEVGTNGINSNNVTLNGVNLNLAKKDAVNRGSCNEIVSSYEGIVNINSGNGSVLSQNLNVSIGNNSFSIFSSNNVNLKQVEINCYPSVTALTYSIITDSAFYEINDTVDFSVDFNPNDLNAYRNLTFQIYFRNVTNGTLSNNNMSLVSIPNFCSGGLNPGNNKDYMINCTILSDKFSFSTKFLKNKTYTYESAYSYYNFSTPITSTKITQTIIVNKTITATAYTLNKTLVFTTINGERKGISDLKYGDIIVRADAKCNSSATNAYFVIRSVEQGESYTYYSNNIFGNSVFFNLKTADSFIPAGRISPYPLAIVRSGNYNVELTCNYVGARNCSGACYNPISSPLPNSFADWSNYLKFGKTFVSRYNANSILDCVCAKDSTLQPILLYTGSANVLVQSQVS